MTCLNKTPYRDCGCYHLTPPYGYTGIREPIGWNGYITISKETDIVLTSGFHLLNTIPFYIIPTASLFYPTSLMGQIVSNGRITSVSTLPNKISSIFGGQFFIHKSAINNSDHVAISIINETTLADEYILKLDNFRSVSCFDEQYWTDIITYPSTTQAFYTLDYFVCDITYGSSVSGYITGSNILIAKDYISSNTKFSWTTNYISIGVSLAYLPDGNGKNRVMFTIGGDYESNPIIDISTPSANYLVNMNDTFFSDFLIAPDDYIFSNKRIAIDVSSNILVKMPYAGSFSNDETKYAYEKTTTCPDNTVTYRGFI